MIVLPLPLCSTLYLICVPPQSLFLNTCSTPSSCKVLSSPNEYGALRKPKICIFNVNSSTIQIIKIEYYIWLFILFKYINGNGDIYLIQWNSTLQKLLLLLLLLLQLFIHDKWVYMDTTKPLSPLRVNVHLAHFLSNNVKHLY